MKLIVWILSFFIVAQPVIINAPSARVELQIRDDYKRLKTILEIGPHDKIRELEIEFVKPEERSFTARANVGATEHKNTTKYKIYTENSRGVWVHELAHFFSYHYTGQDGEAEFICQVLADQINGTLPETRRKFFQYKPFGKSDEK